MSNSSSSSVGSLKLSSSYSASQTSEPTSSHNPSSSGSHTSTFTSSTPVDTSSTRVIRKKKPRASATDFPGPISKKKTVTPAMRRELIMRAHQIGQAGDNKRGASFKVANQSELHIQYLEKDLEKKQKLLEEKERKLTRLQEEIIQKSKKKEGTIRNQKNMEIEAKEAAIDELRDSIEILQTNINTLSIALVQTETILGAVLYRLSAVFPNYNNMSFAYRVSDLLFTFGTALAGYIVESNKNDPNYDEVYSPSIVALVPIAFGLIGFILGWLLDWKTSKLGSLANTVRDVRERQDTIVKVKASLLPNHFRREVSHIIQKPSSNQKKLIKNETVVDLGSSGSTSPETQKRSTKQYGEVLDRNVQRIKVLETAIETTDADIKKTKKRISKCKVDGEQQIKKIKKVTNERFNSIIAKRDITIADLTAKKDILSTTESEFQSELEKTSDLLDLIVKMNSATPPNFNKLFYTSKLASWGFTTGAIFAGVWPVESFEGSTTTATTTASYSDCSVQTVDYTYLWYAPYIGAVVAGLIGWGVDYYSSKKGALSKQVAQLHTERNKVLEQIRQETIDEIAAGMDIDLDDIDFSDFDDDDDPRVAGATGTLHGTGGLNYSMSAGIPV